MVTFPVFYPWMRRISALIRRGRFTPPLSTNHSPPFFAKRRTAFRKAAGLARTVIVGLTPNAIPPKATRTFDELDRRFYRWPHPKSIGQSTFHRRFSVSEKYRPLESRRDSPYVIPMSARLISVPTWREIQNIPIFVVTHRPYQQTVR